MYPLSTLNYLERNKAVVGSSSHFLMSSCLAVLTFRREKRRITHRRTVGIENNVLQYSLLSMC